LTLNARLIPFSGLREKVPEADEGRLQRSHPLALTRACGATSPASGRGELRCYNFPHPRLQRDLSRKRER